MLTMMKHSRILIIYVAVLAVIVTITGCHHNSATDDAINEAELLIESQPDSSLAILNAIDSRSLRGDEQRARYALLMSMALDKNYIDTTSFDVLQPAIDYYLEHGTPDERLRTLYYQGCIYRNRGDDANAMASCIDALELKDVTDTLVLARVYVLRGILYEEQYKIAEYTEDNLNAAKLFHSAEKYLPELRCCAKVIDMSVLLGNKTRSDSLVNICSVLVKQYPEMEDFVKYRFLAYLIKYGSEDELRGLLEEIGESGVTSNIMLTMAMGYSKLGDNERAKLLLDEVHIGGEVGDSLKYYAVASDIYENTGDCKKALDAYKNYVYTAEKLHLRMFSNDLLFAEKKHQIEIDNLVEMQKRDRLINYSLFIISCLLIITIIIFYRYSAARSRRMVAEQANLKLKLEKQKAELELDNMRLEKAELNAECYKLKNLLTEHNELAEPVRVVIKQRFDLLNGLLAKDISENETHANAYRKWIDHIRLNKEEFMESTRIAFKASHPAFINYLTSKGLTDDEIRYVCLYAIGLKGKEVGVYLQLKGHYNISSTIRKKLGIGEHDTNLGIYIKRLMNDVD